MKIAVIGATGFVGSHITKELVSRNYDVVALARKVPTDDIHGANYSEVDVTDTAALAARLKGVDVVVSAFNAGWTNPNLYNDYIEGAQAIQKAVKDAAVKRFVVVGGAGSLFVADGVQLVDTPTFPKDIFPGANAARDYFNILKEEQNLDWTVFSPAPEMHQGITTGRTGKYRLGKDEPVFDDNNRSMLSVEDLAVVIADEIDQQQHSKERFTAAY